MIPISATALWVANGVCNATGFLTALRFWDKASAPAYRRDYRNLLWITPVLALAAYLESAFNAGFVASAGKVPSAPYTRIALDIAVWGALSFLVVIGRQYARKSSPLTAPFSGTLPVTSEVSDPALRSAAEAFVASVDGVRIDAIERTYAPDFVCVRIADSGGFARLSRSQMLSFLSRAATGKSAPAGGAPFLNRETVVHHAETLGDTGVVLMTRVKNLGSGWEPLFYALLWRKRDGQWHLEREFVHQRTAPDIR